MFRFYLEEVRKAEKPEQQLQSMLWLFGFSDCFLNEFLPVLARYPTGLTPVRGPSVFRPSGRLYPPVTGGT
jgi:hypothetical protein